MVFLNSLLTDSNGLSRTSSVVNEGQFSKMLSLNCVMLQLAMLKVFNLFALSANIMFESMIPLLFDNVKCARFVALVNSAPLNGCNLFAVKSMVSNFSNLIKSCL